jgi:hypothetical protein
MNPRASLHDLLYSTSWSVKALHIMSMGWTAIAPHLCKINKYEDRYTCRDFLALYNVQLLLGAQTL